MNESQLIDNLRSALDDTTANLQAAADAAPRARARGRRRRVTRGLLTGVPAVGLVVGVAVVATGATGATGTHGTTAVHRHGPAAAPAVETAAYVTRHFEQALSTVNKYIVKTSIGIGPGKTDTTWTDPVTLTTRSIDSGATGQTTYWITTKTAADREHWHFTFVDYSSHTWWASNSQSSRIGKVLPSVIQPLSPFNNAAQLKQSLKADQLAVVGHGTVNGHRAIELRYGGPVYGKKSSVVAYWIDARTFQPLRMVYGPGGPDMTMSVTWIPKSPANVKQTNTPQIPAGFTHVKPPAGG
jgi:hypothetical protein